MLGARWIGSCSVIFTIELGVVLLDRSDGRLWAAEPYPSCLTATVRLC